MHGWAVALGCGSGWWLLAAPANAVVGTNLSPRSRYLASIAMRSAVTTSDRTSDQAAKPVAEDEEDSVDPTGAPKRLAACLS